MRMSMEVNEAQRHISTAMFGSDGTQNHDQEDRSQSHSSSEFVASSDLVVQLDGVYFRRNDETEFRRVVIQNFIKSGNLAPLTDNTTSS